MGLAGFASAVIKPTALALNVLVSAIGCVRFYRLSLLTWRSAYPFAFLGLPFSLLGGALHLSAISLSIGGRRNAVNRGGARAMTETRHSAILAVDFIGYSDLMGEDGPGPGNAAKASPKSGMLACNYHLHDSISTKRRIQETVSLATLHSLLSTRK
jgi:hypothetical protein